MNSATKITMEDLEIVKRDETYGPQWAVTVKNEPRRHYVLRSTEGMKDSLPKDYLPRTHLDETWGDDPFRHRGTWHGAYPTTDMDIALEYLLEDLNGNARLQVVRSYIEDPLAKISELVGEAEEALDQFPKQSIHELMNKINDAVQQLNFQFLQSGEEFE